MPRLATFIVEHSRRILALTALVTLLSVAMLFRMQFNADVASFVLEGNETGQAFADLQDKYDAADPITVVAELGEGSTFQEPANLIALAELVASLDAVDGTDSVSSVIPATNPMTGGPLGPAELNSIPEPVLQGLMAQSPVADLLVSEDGSATMVFVVANDDPVGTARSLAEVAPPDGIEVTLAGNPVVFAEVIDVLSLFLLAIPPVVMILMLGVFYLNIGDRRLAALAVFPAIIGSVWTFGLIFGLGREVDIITVIVPIFVIVMGSADGLHFVTHFQERAAETDDRADMVASTLRHVGVPMILTTISTAAGFLSLTVTGVQPVEELGLFTAVGITFAGIVSLFALPALLSRLTIRPAHHQAVLGPRITRVLEKSISSRVPALVLVAVILAFAGVFLPRLDVNPDQLFFFKSDDPVREAFQTTEDLFGGATPMFGEFVFDPSSGPEGLAEIAAVGDRLEALPGVKTVFSVAGLAGALPPEQMQAVMAGEADLPFGEMVSDDGLRFVLFPSGFETADLRAWLDFAESEPAIRVFTGMPVVWDEIARLVVRSQIVSLIAAFVLVAIMLAFAYRRARETVISLIPIALTVATLLAFLAASGIQLNLLTAVLSGIVIGVGIDYSIHFIAAIDLAREDGPGYARRAVRSAGRPIVANALGIAVAMTALWLSPLAIHGQVSMIMWVSMVTGAATALLVIPALLPRDAIAETQDPPR